MKPSQTFLVSFLLITLVSIQLTCAASFDSTLYKISVTLPPKLPTFTFTQHGELICPLGPNSIVKIGLDGQKTKLAGNGLNPPPYFSGEDVPAVVAQMYEPQSAALTHKGELIIADSKNRRIRKVDTRGVISTLAGTDTYARVSAMKDGQRAFGSALPCVNQVIAVGSEIYFSTYKEQCLGSGYLFWSSDIFKIGADGLIYHVAGDRDSTMTAKDGKASGTKLKSFMYFTISNDGKELFISETSANLVRKVDLKSGVISIIAGTSSSGFSGDKLPAVQAQLNTPTGIAVDSYTGDVFIADSSNNRIRKIDSKTGLIYTVAGVDNVVYDKMKGEGFSQDGGVANLAKLDYPTYMEFAPNGDLYFIERNTYSKLSRCTKGQSPQSKTGKCFKVVKDPFQESADLNLDDIIDKFINSQDGRRHLPAISTNSNEKTIRAIRKGLKLLKSLE